MGKWPEMPLVDICSPIERQEIPIPGRNYQQLGVHWWGEGAYEREAVDGADTRYPYFNRIHADDLLINKIWARHGSIAIATKEQNNSYVSPEFPIFELDKSLANPRWIHFLTKWPVFWALCEEKAQGTSGKNRIKPQQFLSISIPIPSLDEQQAIIARLDAVAEKARQVEARLDAIEADADRLLAICFRQAIEGASWRSMADVAPVIRKNVEIDPDRRYSEIGARSFGRGLFLKPPFDGAELTWQKPVWIAAGNLVLSNIKAWEGAIAVAEEKHDGCIASHRYITCAPETNKISPHIICYYLLTPDGLEQIGTASPGTADRNRTLNKTALGNIKVPIPPFARQKDFITLQEKVAAIKAKHAETRQALKALLPSLLEKTFA